MKEHQDYNTEYDLSDDESNIEFPKKSRTDRHSKKINHKLKDAIKKSKRSETYFRPKAITEIQDPEYFMILTKTEDIIYYNLPKPSGNDYIDKNKKLRTAIAKQITGTSENYYRLHARYDNGPKFSVERIGKRTGYYLYEIRLHVNKNIFKYINIKSKKDVLIEPDVMHSMADFYRIFDGIPPLNLKITKLIQKELQTKYQKIQDKYFAESKLYQKTKVQNTRPKVKNLIHHEKYELLAQRSRKEKLAKPIYEY